VQVQEEVSLYKDILSFPVIDNIRNSTLKLMNALRWITTHCKSIKLVGCVGLWNKRPCI